MILKITHICSNRKPFGCSSSVRAALIHFSEKPPVKVWPQNIPPATSYLSPKYTYFISSLISGVKNPPHKISKIFKYILRHSPVLHCAVSQSNTINNIELLFMEFTYICIRTIFH